SGTARGRVVQDASCRGVPLRVALVEQRRDAARVEFWLRLRLGLLRRRLGLLFRLLLGLLLVLFQGFGDRIRLWRFLRLFLGDGLLLLRRLRLGLLRLRFFRLLGLGLQLIRGGHDLGLLDHLGVRLLDRLRLGDLLDQRLWRLGRLGGAHAL